MDKMTIISEYTDEDFYFLHLKKDSPVGICNHQWHEHSFYELMLIADGENEYSIENRRYVTRRGDVLLIKPGCHHFERSISKSPTELYCFGFHPEAISSQAVAKAVFDKGEHFRVSEFSLLERTLALISAKLSSTSSNAHGFMKAMAEAVALILCELDITDEPSFRISNGNLERIINYIKDNLANIHSVEDISRAVFFSPSYVRAIFKNEMGIGIMQYVRNKKVLLANRMIREGEKPTDIYLECGFSNYTSFYRAFCAYFGASPKHQRLP